MDSQTPTHPEILPTEFVCWLVPFSPQPLKWIDIAHHEKMRVLYGAQTPDGVMLKGWQTIVIDAEAGAALNYEPLTAWPNKPEFKPVEAALAETAIASPAILTAEATNGSHIKVPKPRRPYMTRRRKAEAALLATLASGQVQPDATSEEDSNGEIPSDALTDEEVANRLSNEAFVADPVLRKSGRRRIKTTSWDPELPAEKISVELIGDVTFWDIFDPKNLSRRKQFDMGTVQSMHMCVCKLMATEKRPEGITWYIIDRQRFGLPLWVLRLMFLGDCTERTVSITTEG